MDNLVFGDVAYDLPVIDHEEIEDRRTYEFPDAREVATYRQYIAGDVTSMLTLKQQGLLGSRATHPMSHNILRVVLQTTASRLKLESWDVDVSDGDSMDLGEEVQPAAVENLSEFLSASWLQNQMSRLQYRTNMATLRDGNSVAAFTWLDGRIKVWLEPWWDGHTGLFVFYKDDDTYDYAVKDFEERLGVDRKIERRNVYLPGWILRFFKDSEGWKFYGDEPITPLARQDGSPLAIPIVHFPNDTDKVDDRYGQSDIAQLLALQDDINASQGDISAVGLLSAFQRVFISGATVPAGDIKLSPGSLFGVPGDARAQTIEPGNPAGLISIHEMKQRSLAESSRTPIHSITGQWPSGAALLQADMPQIDKVEMMADIMGPRYTMLAHRITEYANAFGMLELDEDLPLISTFAPSQRIDEVTEIGIRRQKAELWKILASLPLEAMIQAGVPPEVAQKIKDDEEIIMDVGF